MTTPNEIRGVLETHLTADRDLKIARANAVLKYADRKQAEMWALVELATEGEARHADWARREWLVVWTTTQGGPPEGVLE